MTLRRRARHLFTCVLAASLAGCLSGKIATRAVQYNIAAEDVQNRDMLLNVLRASQRRPLEFTALQTITGTGSVEAQSELDVPLVQNGAEDALSLTQQLGFSDRPTFSISVLDTQEFYQGVLRPLSTQTFDFYLKRNLSKRMLFDLFFSSISVRANAGDGRASHFTAEFDNDVTDDERFDDYQALIEILIDAGLTTTSVKARPTVLGPPLTPDEAARSDLAAKAAGGGFMLKAVGWCGLDAGERGDLAAKLNHDRAVAVRLDGDCAKPETGAAKGPDPDFLRKAGLPQTLYRVEKAAGAPSFVLCIQPTGRAVRLHIDDKTTCEALQNRSSDAPGGESGLHVDFADASPRACAALNRRRASGEPLDCTGDISMEFTFTARSTYEIIRYLGEVVRRADNPDGGRRPRIVTVKMEPVAQPQLGPGRTVPTCDAAVAPGSTAPDGATCLPLFAVRPGRAPADAFVTVRYGGEDYFIAAPQRGSVDQEPTLEVFQLITELLALNRSAKDVPATTVFTVVAP